MKSLPALISLATVAALIVVAVAASLINSVPFTLIAAYVVGIGSSLTFLALFAADYASQPRLLRVVDPAASKRELEALLRAAASRERRDVAVAPAARDEITEKLWSTLGLDREPSTLSLL
jgi:hypothetical protein